MAISQEISLIRSAVLSMETGRALSLFERLQKKLNKGAIKAEDRAKLQADLDEICGLARSTCEGISSARQQIDRIVSESGRVDVYSESGEKISQTVGANLAWKY